MSAPTVSQKPSLFPTIFRMGKSAQNRRPHDLYSGHRFDVTMQCYEENPKAVYMEPDQPVCWDSCMEAFMNFFLLEF